MNDTQLFSLLIETLGAGMTARGYTVAIEQARQPTIQGTNTQDTIYLTKITDRRYGFLDVKESYNAGTGVMTRVESQWYETTIQFQALAIQDPANPTPTTASDYIAAVCGVLQGDTGRQSILDGGAGSLRITDAANPYFVDDRDQFEASPIATLILTHQRVYSYPVPVVSSWTETITSVPDDDTPAPGPTPIPIPPTPTPPTPDTGSTIVQAPAGAAIRAGQVVYVDSLGQMQLANAAGLATAFFVGVALADTAPGFVCQAETTIVSLPDWTQGAGVSALIKGATYYLGLTDGQMSLTPITTRGQTSGIVGVGINATTLEIYRALPIYL